MPSDIAAVTSSSLQAAASRPDPADLVQPDVPNISFRELWSDKQKGFSFADFLDIVNPLQHLPVIGTIYRAVTGDSISLGARLVGGALYGGPIGVMSEAALAAADQAVGGDVGRTVLAAIGGWFDGDSEAAPARLAKIEPASGGDKPAAANTTAAAVPVTVPLHADAAAVAAAFATPSAPPGEVPLAPPAAPRPAAAIAPTPTSASASASAPAPASAPAAAAQPAYTLPARAFPAFPRPRPAPNRGVMMPLHPGLGGQQMMPLPTGATLPGILPAAQPNAGPRADAKPADAAGRRIADAIAAAQRAQTGLLLASIAGSAAPPPKKDADGTAAPFRTQPALPPNASPALVNRTMQRALANYQRSQQLRPPAPAAPADLAAGAAASSPPAASK